MLEKWRVVNLFEPSQGKSVDTDRLMVYRDYSTVIESFSSLATAISTASIGVDDYSPMFASQLNIANGYDFILNAQANGLASYVTSSAHLALEGLELSRLNLYRTQLQATLDSRRQGLLN